MSISPRSFPNRTAAPITRSIWAWRRGSGHWDTADFESPMALANSDWLPKILTASDFFMPKVKHNDHKIVKHLKH